MTSKQQPKQPEPIAIVGLGGLFPGSVDVAAFWNHILRGSDLITDIPTDTHWSVEDYFAKDALERPSSAVDKTYAKRGAFLPKVPFDTLKEGIPPSLLASTDTSQLLAIMVGRAALTECFMGPVENADRSRVSCILGVTSGQELFGQMSARLAWPQWIAGMRAAGIDDVAAKKAADEIAKTFTPWTEASFPGLLGNVVAGRVANRLDLGGSNAVTDAACASSFAAISMGIDELLLGRADVVLTGGVDTINDIFMYMCFTKTPALSAAGDCRPFDAASDGTLLGEGLGMVALKRLSDAERDGNTIYACITGVGTSSDGRSKSIYAPVSVGQSKALMRAYDHAGYEPGTVELVEAHGTGTKAGDAAELGGLRLAFDDVKWKRSDRQWCAVGSVKSQIGHTKSAAGSAGIIKAALALHHKVLPPTIKVSTPNPQIDWADSPFYVNPTLRPWFRGSDHPRRAGVSSFGFGGSNWHITLEEYTKTASHKTLTRRDVEVLALSAASIDALQARASALLVKVTDSVDVAAFCGGENAVFNAGAAARASFVVSSVDELKKHLAAVAKNQPGPAVFISSTPVVDAKVAFIFPGQGSQTVEMGKALALAFEEARGVWDRGMDVLPEVVRAAYPAAAFDDAARAAQQTLLTQTENAQPALGLASMATLRVLQHLGVPMHMTAGHSFGELSALCAAGVFDEKALLKLARRRGELMKTASTKDGAMAAVVGDVTNLASMLAPLAGRVVVANENAPDQAVISGEVDGVIEAMAVCEKAGLRVKRLPVSTAFHSPLVAAASAPLLETLRDTAMNAPVVPVFANTTAAPHGDVDSIRSQLAHQVQAPVHFVSEIKAMAAAGATVFVEVGSGTVLTGLVSRIVPEATSIACDPNKGLGGFFQALARLCVAGVHVDLTQLPAQAAAADVVAPSKTAVMLNGANVGKPPKPAPAAVTISAVPAVTTTKPAAPAPVAAPTVARAAPARAVAAPVPAPAAAQVTTMQKAPAASVAPVTTSASTTTRTVDPQANAAWLSVFKEGQQQTLDAHLAFQKALSDAHASYLAAFESTSGSLVAALHGTPVTTTPMVVTQPAFVAAPVAVAAPIMAKPAPVAAPAPVVAKAAAPAPVVAKAAPAPAAVVAKPAAAPAGNGRAVLFDVVADKTGYPVSALDDSMHLESDLGIDSIKRVEILGALKEKYPAAAGMDALKLAQLATLGEIAAAIGAAAPSTTTAPVKAAPVAAAPNAASSNGNGRAVLFAVVADKTGYPVSALDDTMHLESDLGIDSIKRVEILGALKEQYPAAAGMDALKLAQLATLGEIAAAIGSAAPSTSAPVVAAAPAPASSTTSANGRAVLFAVVADKTGYPVSALDDSMHLESDLGIDSIKRVEILGALKEQYPAAAGMDALKLAQLATLGEIAAAIGSAAPSTSAAPVAAAASSTSNGRAVLFAVVAEKTGYPVSALDDSMHLESDLGIDSIKRVEILGALKEQHPAAAGMDALKLAQLATLGEIAAAIGSVGGASAPVAVAAPVVARASGAGGRAILFAVVAEKTGYPVSALDDSMHLESDLGIDSIKRVEILGALKDQHPAAAGMDALKLAQLATLGEIAAAIGGGASSSSTAAVAAAAPVSGGADGRAILFAVVAEKTGYPVSALDDSMHLESDLGIDSIKRVEILGALKDQHPAAAGMDALKLAQLATLGEIAAAIGGASSSSSAVPVAAPAAAPVVALGESCPRAVVRLAPAVAGTFDMPAGVVAVVNAGPVGARLGDACVTALGRRGVEAVACTSSTLPACGSVLDLSALDATDDTAVAMLKAGLFTLQRAGASLRASGGRAVVVTPGGGRFASTSAAKAPVVLGLSGLVKTARQEWPEVDARLVDIDVAASLDILADSLAAQMVVRGGAEVGLQGATSVSPVEVDAPIAQAASKLVAGDVVVITGGARGVTATCALALTQHVPGLKLAVLQRTVAEGAEPAFARHANDEGALKRAILADAAARGTSVPLREVARMAQAILAAREVRATVAELRQRAEVELFACDVQQEASIESALSAVRQRFGRIDVVVHGAGVLADKRIEDKTAEQVDKVIDTKVVGLLALLAQTRSDNLKALVVFSSVAGRFGNVGQVDYSMANEAMTRLLTVEKQRRPSLIAKALHWGPWEGGMVTPELKAQFASRGITVIARQDGAQAFVNELSQSAPDDVEIVLGASLAAAHDDDSHSADAGSTPVKSSVVVSATTMPFLADHAVKGDVVLPFVVAIDLMASAAAAHLGAQVRTVHSVEMIKGQRLPHFSTSGHVAEVTLVSAAPTSNGTQVATELRVDGVLGYRAVVELSDELEVTPPASRTLPPTSAPSFTTPLYAGTGGSGLLFHGPHFQLIEQLDGVDDMAMVARVQSTRGAGWAGRFTVDVAALDAGLQLLLLWARHRTGGAFLPTRVGAVVQHTLVLPRGPFTCVVEATQPLPSNEVKAVANITFLDEHGRVVFELRDVVAHRLPDDNAFGTLGDDVGVTAPAGAAE